MRLLYQMWAISAGVCVLVFALLLPRQARPPEPQDTRIYRVNGKRR